MTISQALTLMGSTPSMCWWHHQCLHGHVRDLSGPKDELCGARVSHLPVSRSAARIHMQLPRLCPISGWLSFLLSMLRVLTLDSQTYCSASLGIPSLGHLSVMAEVRENPTYPTFCQAHHQALKHEPVERESKT